MPQRIMCFLGTLLILLGVGFGAIACSATQDTTPVAKIFEQTITMTMINPDDAVMAVGKLHYPDLTDDELRTQLRANILTTLIWNAVRADFQKTHPITVTAQEIVEVYQALKLEFPDDVNTITPEELQENYGIEWRMVETAKMDAILYAQYGGEVIFQQSNHREPVGAYRHWFEDYEARGAIVIHDATLREHFWEYYTQEQMMQVPADQIDFSIPWWLHKQ
jgi:hypothetical protein